MKDYNTIVGTLEFRQCGFSFRTIQKRFQIGMGTIERTIRVFDDTGLTLENLKAMDPKAVEELFYPQEQIRRKKADLPDFGEYYRRIHAPGSKVNITFLWYEYKEEHPDGYQLTQFTEYYNRYVKEHYGDADVSMAVERIPGEKMYIDWVGDQPALLKIPGEKELQKVHVFTTTMAFSSMIFAECFTDEKIDKFLKGVVDAVEHYGGVARYFVPDNLRTAISKHTKDRLTINSLFKDLENFYGTIVLPPPPRKPRGKASVESHVSYLETHLIEKLKEETYTCIEDINSRTREIVDAINGRTLKRSASRLELFETYDKPALKPLSGARFSPVDYKVVTGIPDNYHIEYDGHYYSVSYTLHGKPAILKATFHEIIICDQYNRKIAEHRRVYSTFPKYVTQDEHMPKEHLYYRNINQHDGSFYRSWARKFGQNMWLFIDLLLKKSDHEEQAYNSCMGILQACEDTSHNIVEEVATTCLKSNTVYYTGFMKLLKKMKSESSYGAVLYEDEDSEDAIINLKHKNLRGKDNYR